MDAKVDTPLLDVQDLEVRLRTHIGEIQAVRGVDFAVGRGEVLAVVGESGCGKSITVKSVMRLLPVTGNVRKGKVLLEGVDLLGLTEREMQKVRGARISMVFQDPMTSLNPTMPIGRQIGEVLAKHKKTEQRRIAERCRELLGMVGISNPERRVRQYPHELSGGQRQRVMIALALACDPELLIADEPTTALDVTIQAQILKLMKDLQRQRGTSIVLITHNLGVVANMADRVVVMYAGKVMETGTADEIFYSPRHPYTVGLIESMPKLDERVMQLRSIPGSPPDLRSPPLGCPFAARCPHPMQVCVTRMPEVFELSGTHRACCWMLDARAGQTGGSER